MALEFLKPYPCISLEANEDANFCLDQETDGTFILKCSHAYFYHPNGRSADYCDFAVWSEDELVVLRIQPDSVFITDIIE